MKRLAFYAILLFSRCSSGEPDITPPSIETHQPTQITLSSATVGATIISSQSDLITVKGVCWSRNPAPELDKLSSKTENGPGAGSFTTSLSGLSINRYYVRAYAKAKDRVFYGNEVILDIGALVPAMASVKKATNGSDAVEIETTITYTHSMPITERGITWSTSTNPTVTTGTLVGDTGSALVFTSPITGLSPYKNYYVRPYAKTDLGTFYGNTLEIIIIPPVTFGSVTDVDGNVYKTTTINGKEWMAENLKVTRYNDGTSITPASSQDEFKTIATGSYIAYGNQSGNVSEFGYLYNGYAVTGDKKLCMTGWHLPSPGEWTQLGSSLGGMNVAGGRMKAPSGLWASPNVDATNESGFSALPGGSYCRVCLSNTGIFADQGTDGYWWSSSVGTFYYVTNDLASMRTRSSGNINDGLSVRCVKD
ncbi:MAG: fibrobacter succinogenes major paralogous domain-containing protein [Cyclobacteriaceae bacterium]|nr:fibrobacter succinogenes major paralogous domain-containing protein [Cyclobacteriaceae bacterium]